jgi:soluble P-type ATPase
VLSKNLKIYIVTSDEFGLAKQELSEVNCELHIIEEKNMVTQKADLVNALGTQNVVAYGNGMNDQEMLKAARLGIVVLVGNGCAVQSLLAADVQVPSIWMGWICCLILSG